MKLLTGLALLLTLSTSFAQETVKIVAGEAFAPLMWNDNGTPRGVAIEMAKAVFEKAGYKVSVTNCPWSRCQAMAETEGAFIIGFSKNDERIKKFIYSDAYMMDEVGIAVKKDKVFPFSKGEDLKGKTLGAAQGASFGDKYEQLKPFFKLDSDDGDITRMKKLNAGRIDGAIFSLGAAGMNYAAKLAGLNHADFVMLSEPIARDPNFFATGNATKNGKEILEKVNKAIKDLTADGTVDKISKMTF